MAQIITLKEIQDRLPVLREGHLHGQTLGPAQLLFFTGVRYERYGDAALDAGKEGRKTTRKRRLSH